MSIHVSIMRKLLFYTIFVLIISFNLIFASENGSSLYVCPIKPPISVEDEFSSDVKIPFIDGTKILIHGNLKDFVGDFSEITSPIVNVNTRERTPIGVMPMMTEVTVNEILNDAKLAWDNGMGEWPKLSPTKRIYYMKRLVEELKKKRSEIINILMWEICKTIDDASAEFDRTMHFIEESINAYQTMIRKGSILETVHGVMAYIRRSAIGIMLCLGPFNYPFNETYAALIPALLLGNIVIMKIPMVGGLAHLLTLEIFASVLPKGVMNFISGSGRSTLAPLMKSGAIDVFAFIGSSHSADSIIKQHPQPHRLKLFLQLEGKNLGIVLPDADLSVAVEQIAIGTTTFNGQRCTAIKLIFIHKDLVDAFLPLFISRVAQLKAGLPWESGVKITPLPEPDKPQYLEGLISDAVAKGARVVNEAEGGGELHGALMKPAILFPVTSDMRVWREEQFGPVIPIATYDDIQEVFSYLAASPQGLQAAVFTKDPAQASNQVDNLATLVGRVNINTQCARSPDVFPFSARKSSGLGTMSVTEALHTFSIEVVVASKATADNEQLMLELPQQSEFLSHAP